MGRWTFDLAEMLDGYEFVNVRMVLIGIADGWQVLHGEVTLDGVGPTCERAWRYAEEIFLERRVPAG